MQPLTPPSLPDFEARARILKALAHASRLLMVDELSRAV